MNSRAAIETQKATPGSLQAVIVWIRQSLCRHKFRLGDQSATGIPEPEKPAPNASYAEWMEYFSGRDKHPSHTKRVQWPCAKCGKMFYAHCGLDVVSKHGEIIPHNDEVIGAGATASNDNNQSATRQGIARLND